MFDISPSYVEPAFYVSINRTSGTARKAPTMKPSRSIRIVAVGDSITEGGDSSDYATMSWPAQLFNMLGANSNTYEVLNYGVSGRTMMKTVTQVSFFFSRLRTSATPSNFQGDYPYWNESEYQAALEADADIYFIMLG